MERVVIEGLKERMEAGEAFKDAINNFCEVITKHNIDAEIDVKHIRL